MTALTATRLVFTVAGGPDPDLSPNARSGWRAKAKATRDAKDATYWTALGASVALSDDDWARLRAADCIAVTATIGHGYARKRLDDDNAKACLKGHLDGIALALKIDDKRFELGTVTQERAERGDYAGWIRFEVVAP